MTRWTHLHSVGGGALLMALAATHEIWLLTITLAAGIAVGRSWGALGRGAHMAGALIAARVATERQRGKNLRASRLVKLRGVRAKRAELEAAYRRGVIEGRLDAHR